MKIAVISVTEKGRRLSESLSVGLREKFTADRYCFYKHTDEGAADFSKLSELIGKIFFRYDSLVFICACGIAVRAIAPNIRSKADDPAVIVADDCGKHAISLLSGHLGKANELTAVIAEIIGAEPVITTATDIGGSFSPDSFAEANGLIITDLLAAKEIAAAVLEGEMIGLVSDYPCINISDEIAVNGKCRTGIYIGENIEIKPFSVTLHLIPKNIALGIGCKKNSTEENISAAVFSSLKQSNISVERVAIAGSIDLKAGEKGLLSFCRKNNMPITFYTADELNSVKGSFTSSEYVRSVTGCDNVCERSAIACGGDRIIMRKTVYNGVTVAAAEKNIIIDFERKML